MGYSDAIKYSPNNSQAYAYYNALSKFNNARDELRSYELNSNDRESEKYQKLQKEFLFWDEEVPRLSDIAGREEDRLAEKREQKKEKYATSPFYKDDRLDYLA